MHHSSSRNRRSVQPQIRITDLDDILSESIVSTELDLPNEFDDHYSRFNKPTKPDRDPVKPSPFERKEKKFYVKKIPKSELKALKILATMKR